MTNDEKDKVALFRYSTIADLISGIQEGTSKHSLFEAKSNKKWINEKGEEVTLSLNTIERYYYTYLKYGFDGLRPKGRSDKGRSRSLDNEQIDIIKHYVDNHPRMPSTVIYEKMILNGYITLDEVSINTIQRYVKRIKQNKGSNTPLYEMKRYEAANINDIWCCDTTYSFKLSVNGESKRMFIIGIIDDASRLIVGIDVFFNDNYVNFLSVLKSAVSRYGKPKILNLDNGTPYKNSQLELLSARVGISLFHNKPYYGQGKAKIERWFRTMKEHFMASYHLTSKTTIDEFRNDLLVYVNEYNNTIHSSLDNISPNQRFFNSNNQIKYLDSESIDTNFLLELERKVSIDCVIQIDNIEFEVPQKYSKQKIKIRYSSDYKNCYVVNNDGQLERIELLDKIANSQIKRKQPIFNVEANQ